MTTIEITDRVDTNLRVVQRYIEAFNRRDTSVIDEIIHPDFVDRHVPEEVPTGPAGVAFWWQLLVDAFDLEITLEDAIVGRDRIATRTTLRGTHVGPFAGLPATGRTFEVAMMSVERFEDGRIVERWEVYDGMTFLAQLGVLAAD